MQLIILFSCSNGNGSKMNGSLEHLDQPDPDTIKMFVGQIPRSWSETELKELFEPFGAVHQINILRDRTQNPPQSKGKVRDKCSWLVWCAAEIEKFDIVKFWNAVLLVIGWLFGCLPAANLFNFALFVWL